MNREYFDAIRNGPSFGGSVMAYRLAEGGFMACMLERGKAYPPASFPRKKSTGILIKRAVKKLGASYTRSMVK